MLDCRGMALGKHEFLKRFFQDLLVFSRRGEWKKLLGEEWYDVHPLVREHVGAQAEQVRGHRAHS